LIKHTYQTAQLLPHLAKFGDCSVFCSPNFDHDAFMHHALHVLDTPDNLMLLNTSYATLIVPPGRRHHRGTGKRQL